MMMMMMIVQIKNQYVSTVTELNMQMNQLQEELKRSKGEANVSNIQVVELRRTLEDLRSELLIKVSLQQLSIVIFFKIFFTFLFLPWLHMLGPHNIAAFCKQRYCLDTF